MKEDFKLYVAACVTCGQSKQPPAYLRALLKHIMVYAFNDALSIEPILPERDVMTYRRNHYILTITDLFSGYIVAIPTKTQESDGQDVAVTARGHHISLRHYMID